MESSRRLNSSSVARTMLFRMSRKTSLKFDQLFLADIRELMPLIPSRKRLRLPLLLLLLLLLSAPPHQHFMYGCVGSLLSCRPWPPPGSPCWPLVLAAVTPRKPAVLALPAPASGFNPHSFPLWEGKRAAARAWLRAHVIGLAGFTGRRLSSTVWLALPCVDAYLALPAHGDKRVG